MQHHHRPCSVSQNTSLAALIQTGMQGSTYTLLPALPWSYKSSFSDFTEQISIPSDNIYGLSKLINHCGLSDTRVTYIYIYVYTCIDVMRITFDDKYLKLQHF